MPEKIHRAGKFRIHLDIQLVLAKDSSGPERTPHETLTLLPSLQ